MNPAEQPEAVTVNRQLELQLLQMAERFRLTMDLAQVGIWDWDLVTNQVEWNANHYQLLGLQPGAVPGDYSIWRQQVHPEDLEAVEQILQAAIAHQRLYRAEYRIRWPDGTVHWLLGLGQTLADPAGKPIRMLGILLDISDRKQVETELQTLNAQLEQRIAERTEELTQANARLQQELRQREQAERERQASEARFRSSFENAAIGMALVLPTGHFLRVNPALCQILGYSQTELRARTFQELTHPDDLEADLTYVRQVLAGALPTYQIEKRYIHKAGHIVWALLSVSLVRDLEGHPLYFVSQIQDITESYQLERMKAEFISVVSHELRTPLTSMQAALSLLVDQIIDPTSPEGQDVLQIASDGVDRLVRLVNDILDLERLESGKIRLEKRHCNTADLLLLAIDQMQEMANQAGITLHTTLAAYAIWADGDRLLQVLINLLSNAIKFSPSHTQVFLTLDQVEPHQLLFAVQDQGRGIPPEQLDNIFERFQQVDASDSRQKGGTGLGLAICRSIVQQHGGRIWAESIPEQGSVFYFTLPLEQGCGSEACVDY